MLADRKWNEARDEDARGCFVNGMTTDEIAAFLNAKHGTSFSKNAVIGRAGRKGYNCLSKHGPKTGSKLRKTSLPKQKPKIHPIKPPTAPELLRSVDVGPLNVTLRELCDVQCRWPTAGERSHTLFCGHLKLEGSSYCPSHARLSIMPLDQRRKRAA